MVNDQRHHRLSPNVAKRKPIRSWVGWLIRFRCRDTSTYLRPCHTTTSSFGSRAFCISSPENLEHMTSTSSWQLSDNIPRPLQPTVAETQKCTPIITTLRRYIIHPFAYLLKSNNYNGQYEQYKVCRHSDTLTVLRQLRPQNTGTGI